MFVRLLLLLLHLQRFNEEDIYMLVNYLFVKEARAISQKKEKDS
jgi:hypothetical protein